ncbi:phage tail tip lysozyme [Methylobacterium sp. J-001]|uniref:phage tail tip lysozyme n=1 Tax=Methylobacterium sp. J-001 TaxID=2836609 RepID=UPI001FBB5F38|nr:phage tail tip lysozyme [Methylobacterium sp. J-001]MCJ2120664.1 phage tail tip lysozyme [Methylobacterium sp. J-001]
MADEALRMQAEVVDRFSGPLKSLRSQLLDVSRQGAAHGDVLAKGFGKVEGAIQGTAKAASSVLNPAMMSVGVTSLTAGAALAGVTSALNKLAGNLGTLGQFSRETGVAASTLQEFSAVAGKFGVDAGTVEAGTKTFVRNFRELGRGAGEALRWTLMQGTNPASRKAFQDFATDLQRTQDRGEALKKTLQFGETIKDPTERGIFFERFFGTADLARLADGHLGPVIDQFNKARQKIGPLDPKDIIKAEEFQRAIADLNSSMTTIGTTIAKEVLPYASSLAHWLDEGVKGGRGDAIVALRTAMHDFGVELAKIDWAGAGKDAGAALKSILEGLKPLGVELRKAIELIHALRSGSLTDVLRVTTGGEGTLGALVRSVAPRAGDDEIGARAEVEALKKELKAAEYDQETGGPALDFKSREPVLKKRLDDAEKELSRLQGRSPEQRQAEYEAANDKLRKAIESNTDELKRRAAEGASVSKSSAEGGLFGGATIQSAALGGGYRRAPAPSPRGYGGGRFNGLGGSFPDGPMHSPESEGGRRARALGRGGVADDGPRVAGQGAVPKGADERAQRAMARLIARGWTPEAAASAIGQAMEESSVRSDGPLGDTKRFGTGDNAAHGMFQWRAERFRALKQFAEKRGVPWTDFDAQVDFFDQERKHRSRDEREWHLETDVGRGNRTGKKFEGYDGPLQAQRERHARRQLELYRRGGTRIPAVEAQKYGDGLKDAFTRRGEVLADPNDERRRSKGSFYSEEDDRRAARDLGIALRARRAQAEEQNRKLQIGSSRMSEVAGQAGIVGGANVNGSVTTVIEKAGPDARARTDTKGNLFGKVVTVNGRQMAPLGSN